MKIHPVVGANMLSTIEFPFPLVEIVKSHHERWDGQGYPDKLVGKAIPLGARIVAVADAYHAMTTNRPYQPARDAASALAELRHCAGTQFDPTVVQGLERILATEQMLPEVAEVA